MSNSNEDNIVKNKTRSEAMIRAQKKYYQKIKNEQPEVYRERNKRYAKIQYEKNRSNPDFAEINRRNVKKYYDNNKEKISEKRKEHYKENKVEILERQKIARDKRAESNKKNIDEDLLK